MLGLNRTAVRWCEQCGLEPAARDWLHLNRRRRHCHCRVNGQAAARPGGQTAKDRRPAQPAIDPCVSVPRPARQQRPPATPATERHRGRSGIVGPPDNWGSERRSAARTLPGCRTTPARAPPASPPVRGARTKHTQAPQNIVCGPTKGHISLLPKSKAGKFAPLDGPVKFILNENIVSINQE